MLCWYCNVCLTEHMPGVPPQSLSQAPQARVQRKVPPERTPPPPGVQGPWGQPQHLVRPPGPAPGSLVSPGAVGPGPSGKTPLLSQAQSSSPAPSGKIKGIEGEIKHLFLKCLYNHSYLEFCVVGGCISCVPSPCL
jgi:hypothetical protein